MIKRFWKTNHLPNTASNTKLFIYWKKHIQPKITCLDTVQCIKRQNVSYFLYSTSHSFKTATDSWNPLTLLRVQNLFTEFFLRATLRNDFPLSETLRASFSRTSPHSDSSAVNTLTCVFCLTAAPPERVKTPIQNCTSRDLHSNHHYKFKLA